MKTTEKYAVFAILYKAGNFETKLLVIKDRNMEKNSIFRGEKIPFNQRKNCLILSVRIKIFDVWNSVAYLKFWWFVVWNTEWYSEASAEMRHLLKHKICINI